MADPLSLDRVLARARASVASDAEIAHYERQRELARREELLHASGIAEALTSSGADAVLRDRCRPTLALDLVSRWLGSSVPVLVLVGGVGTGKTLAAAWALARTPGRYAHLERLCQLRRERYGDPGEAYHRHLRAELLVVDELGAEEDRDRGVAALHDVVDRRMRLPRRTLVLGNLDARELLERYDRRTLDRLREVAVVRPVRGESLRQRGAA